MDTAALKKEPEAARQKRKSTAEKTVSPVKHRVKAASAKKAEEAEPRPQPLRLRHRPENMRRANVTSQAKEEKPARPATAPVKSRPEAAAEKKRKDKQEPQTKEPQSEENATEKKKPGQRYFQCVYVPGKNTQYPLRPFTPAMSPAMMSPTMMSPAIKSMLEQQRAARTPGQ
ncbi:triadin-like isoform X1 [Cynoglossus semilaevis]|uniref:triadin-like isoform X1 n=1 Tax=Cynoglossus semilaevis TaxID=244447 RepID=UPI000496B223|nr:triadin-like isoform X1 [Cynoglossus semilaevis]